MTNVLDDGGIKKRLIKPGLECDGSIPDKGTVTIQYSLTLEGLDEPYDSTWIRGKGPERYRLSDGQLFYGFELAVKSMLKTEVSEFIIEPEYGFGPVGCPPRIPGNSQILAKIEIVDFSHEGMADSMLAMSPEERNRTYTFRQILDVVAKERSDGNKYFNQKEYKGVYREEYLKIILSE